MMKTLSSTSRALFSGKLSVSGWTMVVTAVSIAAWLATLVFMSGMDEGPGTPLHYLPVFLVGWIVMLTAMMLPSELNYIGAFAGMLRGRGTSPGVRVKRMLSFISGYGMAWIVYGLGAFVLDALLRAISPEVLGWNHAGPWFAGAILMLAGVYQVSSLKHACLTGCRSPFSFFQLHWRADNRGALSMGFRHGLVCVGCCWALMAVMFAVGVMSLTWMALLTLFMFAEKVLPNGQKLATPIAVFLGVMGIWIAVSPDTAPLLQDPMVFDGYCRSL
jgi:predicted metal-binding membrane protein